MLEKFLKKEGTKKLSKEEQKNIAGGNMPPALCWDPSQQDWHLC